MQRYVKPNPAFWTGRRVLVTGHSGFKGAWLVFWLSRMGAKITGLALPPVTDPSLAQLLKIDDLCDSRIGDIRDSAVVRSIVDEVRPEVVIHLAAQALVRESYKFPIATFATNVMGTAHVLDALRDADDTRVALMITTDKVYRNREWLWPYRESDPLGGHDPYSASKAASESVIDSYRLSYLKKTGVAVASARAGNVIGGGDWSADRLVPDAVRAWLAGGTLEIRSPDAIRPWQHVLDPVAAYLVLSERLWDEPDLAGSYNFGPCAHEAATVREVIDMALEHMPGARVKFGQDNLGPHEASWLALDTSRARQILGVNSRFSLTEAVRRTFAWHKSMAGGVDVRTLCEADISAWLGAV